MPKQQRNTVKQIQAFERVMQKMTDNVENV